jgi:hypothetical protein
MTTAEPTPTPDQYVPGSVKQDPDTLAVAVRTNVPDPYYGHDWGVMTVATGGHYSNYDGVKDWTDLAIPSSEEKKDGNAKAEDKRSSVG